MTNVWHQMSKLYRCLDDQNCVCVYGEVSQVQNIWFEWYREALKKGSEINEENQILCIRLIGLSCEVYLKSILYKKHACSNVIKLFQYFTSKYMLDELVNLLKVSKNKFLIWCVIKSLTVLIYARGESYLCNVHVLLTDLKESMFIEENLYIIDLITSIVKYRELPENRKIKLSNCCCTSSSTVTHSKDLFQSISLILSQLWDTLMEQFHHISSFINQSKILTSFIILWENLIHKDIDNHHIFLNANCVIHFFSNACFFSVVPLQMYSNIIMQLFTVNPMMQKSGDEAIYSAAICDALNKGFLEKLPSGQLSSFCINQRQRSEASYLEESSKCDTVIAKKISFICLNGLIGIQDATKLWNALVKVLNFMKCNFDMALDDPLHHCILNVFIDQDDLLFGTMLALLKLYNIFKEEESLCGPSSVLLNKVTCILNPHLIFISFLKQIGFDQNELLSFLTSDETCFLLYLLQYTKVLINEKDTFVQAHSSILCTNLELDPTMDGESICELNSSADQQNLVDYSSSSDEESTVLPYNDSKNCDTKNFKDLCTIRTLSRLCDAIQKLVDVNEFPYAVSPLLTVLSICEGL